MKFNLKLTGVTVENITIGGVEYSSEYSATEFLTVVDEFKTIVNDAPSFAQKIVEIVKLLEGETEPQAEEDLFDFDPDFDIDLNTETGLDIDGDKHDSKVYRYAVYYFGGDSTAFLERYPVGVSIPSTCGNYELDKIFHSEEEAEQHVKLLML